MIELCVLASDLQQWSWTCIKFKVNAFGGYALHIQPKPRKFTNRSVKIHIRATGLRYDVHLWFQTSFKCGLSVNVEIELACKTLT
jgi:hypothetical protein